MFGLEQWQEDSVKQFENDCRKPMVQYDQRC